MSGCGRSTSPAVAASDQIADLDSVAAVPGGPSWAPRPQQAAGLRTLARAQAGQFSLSTEHGAVGFLSGVNLGSTTPGHQPGELSISAAQYRVWFAAMRRLGIRVVRIYTIHPPAFYQELRRYNTAHPTDPLYLVQGVYLPDMSYETGRDLYAAPVTTAFQRELQDAVRAVHGDLDLAVRPGHASGTWRADVSDWLVSWLIGVELDPTATLASDRSNATQPAVSGRYFTSTSQASPTERWLAARMDEVAAAEAARGRSVPIAFVNWPTTDPLRHPAEPNAAEDLVGVDANHVQATVDWPGGQFASYHAYPYYPDFQRHEAGLAAVSYQGRPDPYAGYLTALRQHHAAAGLPVMVTEFGVPSAIGSAHAGPLGRGQGDHSEQEALRIDAELLRLIKEVGLAGGLLFSWSDEWFKVTWNTMNHQVPADRRQLWHDSLTNEQWFGILAADPLGPAEQRPVRLTTSGAATAATVRIDEGYLYLDLRLRAPADRPVTVALDPVPGLTGSPGPGVTGDRADVVLTLDPTGRTGRVQVRQQVDPLLLDSGSAAADRPAAVDGWVALQLMTNRAQVVPTTGQALGVELQDVGNLRWGTWDPHAADYDSRALWNTDGTAVHLRLPWAMAGLSDPSSHRALYPGAPSNAVSVPGLDLSVTSGGATLATGTVTWAAWQSVRYRLRLKAGAGALRDAFAAS